jgi:hypothetical protein
VRIHEYAHAVVHLGVDIWDATDHLEVFGQSGTTDWGPFRTERDKIFASLEPEVHELLAQAITWACVCRMSTELKSDRLVETFVALEARQARAYRLAPEVQKAAIQAGWPLVLRAARGEVTAHRSGSFGMREGISAIIVRTANVDSDPEAATDDRLEPLAREIQRTLADRDTTPGSTDPDAMHLKFLYARKDHVELRMHKEAAHARPHFHIEFKQEFAASYALDSFERLAGYMPRKYEEPMLAVARARQHHLLELWRSANGPVRYAVHGDGA